MNSPRPREYAGSHIVFSGMNPEITLREHQKNAIAHVLYLSLIHILQSCTPHFPRRNTLPPVRPR